MKTSEQTPGQSVERTGGGNSREVAQRLGATYTDEGTTHFLVWAPRAQTVEVHIQEPNERMIPMEAAERGYFYAGVEDAPPGTLYMYRLDGEKERPDPASRFQPQGVHGPSQVAESDFDWRDDAWTGISLEKYILYELHVGAFTPEGTLEAIIPRLAKLKELGITAIELMPPAQFPGSRNWGYDGVYPYAVQDSYGGPAALKRLVNECHNIGMAVVLDVVYNHLGPEGNYLGEFAPYINESYKTPWGGAMNFDGPHSDEVRRYFIENALQWIVEFHVDALRLDAIHAIVDPSATPFLEELATVCHAKAEELGRRVYLFPESNRNDAREVNPRERGGWGLDSVWNDDFHHALHVLLTGEQTGYYEDFSGVADMAAAMRDGFIYQGQYSKFRKRRHGNSSRDLAGEQLVIFTQNHDQVGNRMQGDRLSQSASLEQLKLAAGAMLLSPYVPLLFMGEEYGERAPFQYFVSHGDTDLIEAVRRGRKAEFAEFNWAGEIPDPQDEGTFARSKLDWELRNEGQHRLLWEYYRELIGLRGAIPALAQLDKQSMNVMEFSDKNTVMVSRECGASKSCAIFHFDGTPAEIQVTVAGGRWQKRLDSSDPRWGGEGSQAPERLKAGGQAWFPLPGWACILFATSDH